MMKQKQYLREQAKVIGLSNLPEHELIKQIAWMKNWKGKPAIPQQSFHFNSAKPGMIYLVDMPKAQQSVVRIGRLAKPFDVDGDYFKANLANYPFGGFFNSRINLNIREDKGYTYGVNSAFTGDLKFGLFTLATDVQVDVTAAALEQLVKEMKTYKAQGMTESELQFMRASLLQQQALSYETPSQKVNFLGEIQRFGLPQDFPQKQDAMLAHISQKTLNQIIEKEFDIDNMLILVVGPKQQIMPQLKKLGYPVVDLP